MITATMPVTKRCPFRSEDDPGQVSVTCRREAPELHELAGRITRLAAARPYSHEEFTRVIAGWLPAWSVVTTTWRTGGWDVTVTERAPGWLRRAWRAVRGGHQVVR